MLDIYDASFLELLLIEGSHLLLQLFHCFICNIRLLQLGNKTVYPSPYDDDNDYDGDDDDDNDDDGGGDDDDNGDDDRG